MRKPKDICPLGDSPRASWTCGKRAPRPSVLSPSTRWPVSGPRPFVLSMYFGFTQRNWKLKFPRASNFEEQGGNWRRDPNRHLSKYSRGRFSSGRGKRGAWKPPEGRPSPEPTGHTDPPHSLSIFVEEIHTKLYFSHYIRFKINCLSRKNSTRIWFLKIKRCKNSAMGSRSTADSGPSSSPQRQTSLR